MVVEHPFGQQGPAPADDPHDAVVQQRQVLPEHAGVDREEVHALFRLLLHRLQDDVVGDVLDLPAFDHLVDRHRPEGHGTMREQLGADGVEIAPGAQVHHRVGADRQGRLHLLDLGLDRAADAAGADIGVDLRPQGPADAGGLEIALEMNLIGGDHQPPGRDLVADESGVQPLALGDLPHGLGDGSGSGFGQLCRHDALLLAANKKIAPAGKRFVGSTPTCPSLSYAGLSAHSGVYPDQVPRVFSQARHRARPPLATVAIVPNPAGCAHAILYCLLSTWPSTRAQRSRTIA